MQTANGIIEIIFCLVTYHIPSRWAMWLEVEILNTDTKEAKYFHQYGILLDFQPLWNKYLIIMQAQVCLLCCSATAIFSFQKFQLNHTFKWSWLKQWDSYTWLHKSIAPWRGFWIVWKCFDVVKPGGSINYINWWEPEGIFLILCFLKQIWNESL
jgi:hypothetical protein